MHISTFGLQCDMSVRAVAEAASMLGVLPRDLQIVCSTVYAATAQEVMEKYGIKIVTFVPPEMLCEKYAWAVRKGSDWIWSRGVG